MALSLSDRAGDMIGGIKDKINDLTGRQPNYDDAYYEEYDEYNEEYDEYDDGQNDQQSNYDRYDTVTDRPAGTSRGRRGGATYTPLVSIDDVRRNTRETEARREPTVSSSRSSIGRASVGRASDFQRSGAEIDAGMGSTSTSDPRRVSYNSLFESTQTSAEQSDVTPASSVGQGTHPARNSYDPYQAYEGAGFSKHAPTRRLTILSPTDYSDVEGVARALKAGDAVVLSLRNAGSQLSKRILDFSFGVASALDANVDCIADRVFAIARGNSLSEEEMREVRMKGVM